jgi:hypothetical protein
MSLLVEANADSPDLVNRVGELVGSMKRAMRAARSGTEAAGGNR